MFGQTNDISSLKGAADSLVVVNISTIREANVKLTERLYLKEICAQQDTIITNQKSVINEYISYNLFLADENLTLQKNIKKQKELNESLEKHLNCSKTLNWVLGGVSVAAVTVIALKFIFGGK